MKIKERFDKIGKFITEKFLTVIPVASISFYGGGLDEVSPVILDNQIVDSASKTGLKEKVPEIINPIVGIILPVILFLIGIFVLLNKKISNKIKIGYFVIAILLIILGIVLI